jgi:hypothetical protein
MASRRVDDASEYMTKFFSGLKNSYTNFSNEFNKVQKENQLLRNQRIRDLMIISQLQEKIIKLQEEQENDQATVPTIQPHSKRTRNR